MTVGPTLPCYKIPGQKDRYTRKKLELRRRVREHVPPGADDGQDARREARVLRATVAEARAESISLKLLKCSWFL